MNKKGQASLEVLVIFGVLVLGVVIFGIFYYNSHRELTSNKLDDAARDVANNLSYQKEQNPSSINCGNILCEPGENCSNCSSDCGSCPIPQPTCGDGSCNGTENCETCESDCGICPPPEPICKGTGTIEDPKQICTPEDLYNIRDNLSWYYILNNDLDLDPVILKNEDWYDYDKGWEPIGTSEEIFTGSFDGQNFTIYNLFITRPEEDYVGLFGYSEKSNIKNLLFYDVYPTGNNYVGSLLGACRNNCIISNIHVLTGTITGNSIVGGLVGEITDSQIDKSHTKTGINSTRDIAGGLVGYSENSIISECYASGWARLIDEDSTILGGLVGHLNNGSISNSHSFGDVSGGSVLGGLVALNEGGEISYCYSNVVVSGKEEVGGLVAQIIPEIIDTSNYWDIDSSNQKESAMGKGYTQEEMIKQDNYIDWDFKDIWAIDEGNSPPYLINNPFK